MYSHMWAASVVTAHMCLPGCLVAVAVQPNLNPQSGRCSIRGCPCQQAPWSQIALDRATRAITALAKLPDSDRLETLEVSMLEL